MTVNKTWTESDVIRDAIGERTVREAQSWINEALPEKLKISHSSVQNWKKNNNLPLDGTLRILQIFYPLGDPRHELGKTLTEMRIRALETGKVS